MAFENVKMDPIAEAFEAWKVADHLASEAFLFAQRAKTDGYSALRFSVSADLISTGSGFPVDVHKAGGRAIAEMHMAMMNRDALALVESTVEELRKIAEAKRQDFLRACMNGIAGE